MDLNVGDLRHEIVRELAINGTPIVVQWNEPPAGAKADPVDGSYAALTPRTATIKAFVHQVQPAGASSVRQFAEVESGDMILDFAPDADLDGKLDLVFVIHGKAYVQKEITSKLAQSWDVTIQGERLFRSVVVRVSG